MGLEAGRPAQIAGAPRLDGHREAGGETCRIFSHGDGVDKDGGASSSGFAGMGGGADARIHDDGDVDGDR